MHEKHIPEIPIIAIVIPCYNEQEVLPITLKEILNLLDNLSDEGIISPESFILCCNDGSKDQTWGCISSFHAIDTRVKGISLAHNRGQQFALLAGLIDVKDKCDASISIDADLQDDPHVIREMIEKYKKGCDIVYGVRSSRETDSWFKRCSAHAFYSLQKFLDIETVFDVADYRLMSRYAIEILSQYGERNLYLRGIIPDIGLRSDIVYYKRNIRVAGESKYPLKKMISFSVDGITSFSSKPIKLIFYIGVLMLFFSIATAIYVLLSYIGGNVIAGWTSIMISVWFIGSLILISLGIIGTYIGKIYIETKARPRYFINERID